MINSKEIQFGVCYYPEHWPKMRWETDLKMMKSSGIQMIRIGEFAWSIFEPEDGHFDFSFFDDFLDLAEQNSIRVIFGTPTATPPAWLTERCPEILNCDRKKVPYVHGGRRHYIITVRPTAIMQEELRNIWRNTMDSGRVLSDGRSIMKLTVN